MNLLKTTPNFCKVDLRWPNECVYVVAGGPSLHGFDFDQLKGKNVIAVKSAAEHLPWASMYVSMDAVAWKTPERLAALSKTGFKGEIWMAVPEDYNLDHVMCKTDNVKFIIRDNICNTGISPYPDRVYGFNSAVMGLNIAFLGGADRIVLMGFDLAKGGYWYDMQNPNWVNDRMVSGKVQTREDYIKEQVEYMHEVELDLIADGVDFRIYNPVNQELDFIRPIKPGEPLEWN